MGAWIEIKVWAIEQVDMLLVALYMGAWIEILHASRPYESSVLSHSIWVRGLKFLCNTLTRITSSHSIWVRGLKYLLQFGKVALYMGAWIKLTMMVHNLVALYMGAWIEI